MYFSKMRFFCAYNVYLALILCNVQCTNDQRLNDICELSSGTQGTCVPIANCPSAIELVRSREPPKQCSFNGSEPIVCCALDGFPDPSTAIKEPGAISKQKCRDTYANFLSPIFSHQSPRARRNDVAVNDSIPETGRKAADDADTLQAPQIIGGNDSPAEKYSHMAALGYGSLSDPVWACGGSLISEKYVLTAAHCIDSNQLGRVLLVRLGDLNLDLTTDRADPQTLNVSRAIAHPNYKPPSVYNDIALLELDRRPRITNFVRPACLQTEANILDPIWIATGWGTTSFLGDKANHLQEVAFHGVSWEVCQNAYSSTPSRRLKHGIDAASQMCAGDANKDTCQGDSGGPLQIRYADAYKGYVIIGVTSFGKACGIGTTPGVYTRVSHYIKWIESVVWQI